MEPRWNNIFIFFLLIVGGIIVRKFKAELFTFLSSVNHVGPGHSSDEVTTGLVAAGLIGVVIVCVAKILTSGGDRENK